ACPIVLALTARTAWLRVRERSQQVCEHSPVIGRQRRIRIEIIRQLSKPAPPAGTVPDVYGRHPKCSKERMAIDARRAVLLLVGRRARPPPEPFLPTQLAKALSVAHRPTRRLRERAFVMSVTLTGLLETMLCTCAAHLSSACLR